MFLHCWWQKGQTAVLALTACATWQQIGPVVFEMSRNFIDLIILPGSQKINIFWHLKLFRFSAAWMQQGDIIGCVYIVDSYSNVGGKQA
jgi:hypothetical protein